MTLSCDASDCPALNAIASVSASMSASVSPSISPSVSTLTILWTKDGSLISTSGDSRIILRAHKNTLTITNVSRADSGEYRCVASNSDGNATSNPATLDVQCKFRLIFE